jgi:hypothetical protein
MRWVHDANCFLARYPIDPARQDEFYRPSGPLAVEFLLAWKSG